MSTTRRWKTKYILISIITLVVIIGGTIFMFFYTKKIDTTEIIDSYITDNDYEELIEKKEIVYDSKQGNYMGEVVFKDEPENYYEIYVDSTKKEVDFIIAYDNENEEIIDKSHANYIDG